MLYIGDTHGEIPLLIQSGQCGVTVSPFDARKAADFVLTLTQDRPMCRLMGTKARTLFDQRFEKAYAVEHWQREIVATMQPR